MHPLVNCPELIPKCHISTLLLSLIRLDNDTSHKSSSCWSAFYILYFSDAFDTNHCFLSWQPLEGWTPKSSFCCFFDPFFLWLSQHPHPKRTMDRSDVVYKVGSSLIIENVTMEDGGLYICRTFNETEPVTRLEANVTVTVYGECSAHSTMPACKICFLKWYWGESQPLITSN